MPSLSTSSASDRECILVLQGGGALGAYQAGVFESLAKGYCAPTWVAGISIGAINAALVTGNPPATRVARLREFWELVTSGARAPLIAPLLGAREAWNESSASQALLFGVPGFFKPRFPPAPFQPHRARADAAKVHQPLTSGLERRGVVVTDRLQPTARLKRRRRQAGSAGCRVCQQPCSHRGDRR